MKQEIHTTGLLKRNGTEVTVIEQGARKGNLSKIEKFLEGDSARRGIIKVDERGIYVETSNERYYLRNDDEVRFKTKARYRSFNYAISIRIRSFKVVLD